MVGLKRAADRQDRRRKDDRPSSEKQEKSFRATRESAGRACSSVPEVCPPMKALVVLIGLVALAGPVEELVQGDPAVRALEP